MVRVFDILRRAKIIVPCGGVAIREEDSSKSLGSKKKARDPMSRSAASDSSPVANKRRRTANGFIKEGADEAWYTTNFSLLHRLIRDNHMRDFVASKFEDSSEDSHGIGYAFGCMLRAARETPGGVSAQSCKFVRGVSFESVDASRPVYGGLKRRACL